MICPTCGADTAYDDPCPKDEDSCGLNYQREREELLKHVGAKSSDRTFKSAEGYLYPLTREQAIKLTERLSI